MASTNPKGSDIDKKRIKMSEQTTPGAIQTDEEFSVVYNYLEAINFILNNQLVAQNFEKEVNRMALNWPVEISLAQGGVNLLTTNSKAILFDKTDSEEMKQLSTAAESSLSPNNSETKIEKISEVVQIESPESYTILETRIRNPPFCYKTPVWTDYTPDPSFDILISYLRDSLGEEQRYGAVEISPIAMTNGGFETDTTRGTSSELENITESVSVKIDRINENLPKCKKEKYCLTTPFGENENANPVKFKKSEEQFAELLIGDIDLHSELQNYLKESKSNRKFDTENIPAENSNYRFFGPNEEKSSLSERNCNLDMNQLKTHINTVPEIKSPSEEIRMSRKNRDLSPCATNGVRRIQMKIDSKDLPQETSFVKGSSGEIGFPVSDAGEREKLVSQLVSLLFNKRGEQPGYVLDRDEKVSPMRDASRVKKVKNKLPHSNSTDCLPVKQTKSNMRDSKSDSNQFQKNDIAAGKGIKTKEENSAVQSNQHSKWSPGLDELAEIYSCILKHNSKKKSSKISQNVWLSSIQAELKTKLQEKQNKMDLINFTKTLKECFKPPDNWKPGAEKSKHKKLQEYVNMFQEILLSSLSIEQITYLNNVISQFQEQESLFHDYENETAQQSPKFSSESEMSFGNDPPSPPVALKETKKEEPKPARRTPTPLQNKPCAQAKKPNPVKTPVKKNKPVENAKTVALSPPAELETVLKSTFNSENATARNKHPDKILVNVKLCGSRVLVNDFSYIRDERHLGNVTPTPNKVSELIIENITRDRSKNASLSDLSEEPSKTKKSPKKPLKKTQNIKIVLKASKSDALKSIKKSRIKNEKKSQDSKPENDVNQSKIKNEKKSQDSKPENDVNQSETSKPAQECKNVSPLETIFTDESLLIQKNQNAFEYDQERLKVQHPIDAIIETSESKIMEHAESIHNIGTNEKSPEAIDTLKKIEVIDVKETLNETVGMTIYSNELACDLCWSNENLKEKDLVRTKSHNIWVTRTEDLLSKGDKTNAVKCLDDMHFKPKNVDKKNRKVSGRQHNTYFCYPSLVVQDKPVKTKKKTKEIDSKVVKKRSLKTVKKTDSKAKANPKILKKAESKVVRTTSAKAIKRTELAKKTNVKPVKKANLKGSVKRCEKYTTFSSQVAASERLARRPERFSKPTRTRPKRKENTNHPAKAPASVTPVATGLQNSTDSVLYFRVKEASDFGSETSSFNASTGSSYFEDVVKHKHKVHSDNSNRSTSSSEASEILEKYKNGPIVIFSTADDSDDAKSQFAIIRSDSILKTLSRPPLSNNKVDSVFKSHSDLKFYPGRISDSTEDQQPWVTFILTPQQQAKANLPANQVKIVDKRNLSKNETQKVGNAVKAEKFEDDQIPLSSIEKFIDELKETSLRVETRQKELQKFKNERKKFQSSSIVKQKMKWSSYELPTIKAVKRHDCLKSKPKMNLSEVRRRTEKKHSGSETVLAKVIVNILQFLLDQKTKGGLLCEGFESETDLDSEGGGEDGKWKRAEKTTNEMLNTVINGVTKFEKLVKKNKLVLAVKAELEERAGNPEANVAGLLELSKKIDALKSLQNLKMPKVMDEIQKGAEEEKPPFANALVEEKLVNVSEEEELPLVNESEEEELPFIIAPEEMKIEMPPMEVPMEEEVKDLGRKPSTYFDAEEKFKDFGGCIDPLEYQSGEPFAKTVLEPLGEIKDAEAEEKTINEAPENLTLTSSDEKLLSMQLISKETEELIFSKINENLGKNNIFYSMALFDSLVKRKGLLDKDKKLQNILNIINEKSKKLMLEMEKSAWLKLYFLLGEVSRMYETQAEESTVEAMYRYITNQLNKTLAFIGNVEVLNNKMGDIHNFLLQSKIYGDFDLNRVLSKFLTRLTQLKNTIIPKLTCSVMRLFEDDAIRNDSGYEIRAVKAAHNLYNAGDESEKEGQTEYLKNQIRDLRLFIEYLKNSGSDSTSADLTDVKNRVSEKIMVVEKSMSNVGRGDDFRSASQESLMESVRYSLSLGQLRSFLGLAKACRNSGMRRQNAWNLEECI